MCKTRKLEAQRHGQKPEDLQKQLRGYNVRVMRSRAQRAIGENGPWQNYTFCHGPFFCCGGLWSEGYGERSAWSSAEEPTKAVRGGYESGGSIRLKHGQQNDRRGGRS